jgi:hypothetical protein
MAVSVQSTYTLSIGTIRTLASKLNFSTVSSVRRRADAYAGERCCKARQVRQNHTNAALEDCCTIRINRRRSRLRYIHLIG